jgi:hypothetical protein
MLALQRDTSAADFAQAAAVTSGQETRRSAGLVREPLMGRQKDTFAAKRRRIRVGRLTMTGQPLMVRLNSRGRGWMLRQRSMTLAGVLVGVLLPVIAEAQVNCTQMGNQIVCSNGQSATTIGNTDIYSNGGIGQRIGNQYIYTPPPTTISPPPMTVPSPMVPVPPNPWR